MNIRVYKPTSRGGVLVTATALAKNVPAPFAREVTEGLAHKIHHKFVVVDFNGSDPVLFTGSSNLAEGGEGASLSRATTARPLRLQEDREKWWKDYYREGNIKLRERLLFAR